MNGLDTNVLVRYITQDDENQALRQVLPFPAFGSSILYIQFLKILLVKPAIPGQ